MHPSHTVTQRKYVEFVDIVSGKFVIIGTREIERFDLTGPVPPGTVAYRFYTQCSGTVKVGDRLVSVIETEKCYWDPSYYFIEGELLRSKVDRDDVIDISTTIFPKTVVGDDPMTFITTRRYRRAIYFPHKYNTTVVLSPNDVMDETAKAAVA